MSGMKEEVAYRRRLADALGTPEERKRLRIRCGYSLRDVAEMTGLNKNAVAYRESAAWKHMRGSLDSAAGIAYAEFVIACRGKAVGEGAST
jgi:transcriptional regulator with XRE-family HTH domain